MPKDRVLVPIDYTGCAYEVVGPACRLTAKLGADVVLLYVVRLPTGLVADGQIFPYGATAVTTVQGFLDDDAREHLEPLSRQFIAAGCKVEIAIQHGNIPDAILRVADDVGASMVIMGTHGRKGLRRLIEGSVAEEVIRRANCPVVTIRTQDAQAHPGVSLAQEQAIAETMG